MSIVAATILQKKYRQVQAGQNGYFEVEGIATFNANDSACFLEIPFAHINKVVVQAIGGQSTTALVVQSVQLGSISATAAFNAIAPIAGTLNFVKFVCATTVTKSDANYWSIGVVNKTQTLTSVPSTVAANTTKSTGGSQVTAYTGLTLTNSTTSSNLAVSQFDVNEITFTKTDTAPTMTEGSILIGFSATNGGSEELTIDDSSLTTDGQLVRDSSGNLTIYRKGLNLTSGLAFSFEIRGQV